MHFAPRNGLWLQEPLKEHLVLVETKGLLDNHFPLEFEIENVERNTVTVINNR